MRDEEAYDATRNTSWAKVVFLGLAIATASGVSGGAESRANMDRLNIEHLPITIDWGMWWMSFYGYFFFGVPAYLLGKHFGWHERQGASREVQGEG